MSTVHSILPPRLAAEADGVLARAGLEHVAHGTDDPVAAAERAAGDPRALALIGPYRSRAVAEAAEVTAPAGLALLAPVATWAGVTRDDEPGCDDPARHRGTVLRLLARDTVVAARIAADVRAHERRAFVIAGEHEYGVQLDAQLRLADLPRAERAEEADLIVLCGLAGEPEIARAAELAPLRVVAFDGVQASSARPEARDTALLGSSRAPRDVMLALPFEPVPRVPVADLLAGVERAHRAADLVGFASRRATDRAAMLATLRELGPFDAHGDPVDPDVWLWRAGPRWDLRAHRPL